MIGTLVENRTEIAKGLPQGNGFNPTISRCPFSGKLNPNRWNISGLIKRFRAEGANPVTLPVHDGVVTDPKQFKIDTYAFSAIIIPDVLTRVFAQRDQYPPFGLLTPDKPYPLESFSGSNPFSVLDESINFTLVEALKATIAGVKNNPEKYDPATVSVFQSSERYFREERDLIDLDTRYFIGRGINTATEVMSKVLEVIPAVYAQEQPEGIGNSSIYLEIARNSYPLLQSLAREHVSLFSKVSNELRGGWPFHKTDNKHSRVPFSPHNFTISEGGLAIKTNVIAKVIEKFREHFERVILGGLPAIGCPASYSSSIKDLWDWHLQLAPDVYKAWEASKA